MEYLKKDPDIIKTTILDYIGNETKKRTPVDIVKYIKSHYQIPSKLIKSYIKELVSSGDLEYSNSFGRSFLEISYSKPVKISERIVLTPPQIKFNNTDNDVFVVIEKGISFGRGTHPTTRLCLQAIDFILKDERLLTEPSIALDIGTGSGVLVIAGVLLGIESAHACDLDTVSLNEAKINVEKNKLNDKILVSKYFDPKCVYGFIFANLRFPTLIDLYDSFLAMTQSGAFLFLSGIKTEEKEKIENKFIGLNFDKIWEKNESGWVCFVFKRKKLM